MVGRGAVNLGYAIGACNGGFGKTCGVLEDNICDVSACAVALIEWDDCEGNSKCILLSMIERTVRCRAGVLWSMSGMYDNVGVRVRGK
jgi:hypothetical protein